MPASSQVRLACEIQCLLRDYRDVRFHMHLPYRVIRATTPETLHRDFVKYRIQVVDGDAFVLLCVSLRFVVCVLFDFCTSSLQRHFRSDTCVLCFVTVTLLCHTGQTIGFVSHRWKKAAT